MERDAGPVRVVEHYATGTPRSEGLTVGGEMHGDWSFYRLDGSVMRTGKFDRGRQVGVWRTFDRAGRLVKETDLGADR